MLDNIIGVEEAAEILNLSPGTIKNMCAANRLPSKKVGKTWVLDKTLLHTSKFVDFYTEGEKLFREYVQELVESGWEQKQIFPNCFIMTDTVGKQAFFTCEYEKLDFRKEIYSITAKIETEDKEIHKVHLGTIHEHGVTKG